MNDLFDELQQTFGSNYTMKRELLGGGMARVFVARDESLGRDVVVKVLPPELTYNFSAARFSREIKLAAALQEPHIVPVLTAGQPVGGLPYFTMPFVRGESLRTRILKGPVSLEESLTILHDVARALAYAHRQGIVHRDIKPENILIGRQPEGLLIAKISDFGLAKSFRGMGMSSMTFSGEMRGTVPFMPPEQITNFRDVSPAADQYSTSAMLYYLLTGEFIHDLPPWPRALVKIVNADPVPIRDRLPEVPEELAVLIHTALATTLVPLRRAGRSHNLAPLL